MILDSMEMFFDNADITGTSNVIDLGSAGVPKGEPIKIMASVPNAANDGTIALQHCDTEGGSYTAATTFNVTAAALKAGTAFQLTPDNLKRYVNVVVTTTTGTGWIGLALDTQSNL